MEEITVAETNTVQLEAPLVHVTGAKEAASIAASGFASSRWCPYGQGLYLATADDLHAALAFYSGRADCPTALVVEVPPTRVLEVTFEEPDRYGDYVEASEAMHTVLGSCEQSLRDLLEGDGYGGLVIRDTAGFYPAVGGDQLLMFDPASCEVHYTFDLAGRLADVDVVVDELARLTAA